jgi:hypothetical protein
MRRVISNKEKCMMLGYCAMNKFHFLKHFLIVSKLITLMFPSPILEKFV